MALEQLVEGWTERISETLTDDGIAVNLTGMTVTLLVYPRGSLVVKTLTGTAGIATAGSGLVYFDPSSADLVASESPYKIRWKVTDTNNKVAFWPHSEPAEWVVRKP